MCETKFKLKEKRLELGLTQAEVAKIVGIAESAYQRYEYGICIPNVIVAIRIARILLTTVEELYDC